MFDCDWDWMRVHQLTVDALRRRHSARIRLVATPLLPGTALAPGRKSVFRHSSDLNRMGPRLQEWMIKEALERHSPQIEGVPAG